MSVEYCEAINPDTGDRCQEARGHPGGHYVTRVDRWETPYRMTEPNRAGAVVVSDYDLYVRINTADKLAWLQISSGGYYRWEDIADPQPDQNCHLTADDPEPPVGSVILFRGRAYQRYNSIWVSTDLSRDYDWGDFTATVVLVYRSEA